MTTTTPFVRSRNFEFLMLVALCALVYAPALNNGFIADDYPFLDLADKFTSDFLVLFRLPPLNFRLTTFVVFAILEKVFGLRPEAFHVFTVLLHLTNCLLLWKLILLLGRPRIEAYLAAVVFAAFHAPQEAVMWSAAVGEVLQGFCILTILIFWVQRRYALSILFYCIALLTKESAPIVLILLPMIQWQRKEPVFTKPYLIFWLPTIAFGVLFLTMWRTNSFIQNSVYAFGLQAPFVLVRTFHRLIWPWLYILIILLRLNTGKWLERGPALNSLALFFLFLAPYIFLSYASALPSRHLYLASMVMAGTLAYALCGLTSVRLRQAFLCVFLLYNVGYMWIRKDGQFEERAAPTTALLQVLRTHPPAKIMIFDFPYPYAEIPKAISRWAPGWSPDLIEIDGSGEACAGCLNLRWDKLARRYEER